MHRPVKKKGGTAAGLPRTANEANSSSSNGLTPKDPVSHDFGLFHFVESRWHLGYSKATNFFPPFCIAQSEARGLFCLGGLFRRGPHLVLGRTAEPGSPQHLSNLLVAAGKCMRVIRFCHISEWKMMKDLDSQQTTLLDYQGSQNGRAQYCIHGLTEILTERGQ